MGSAIQLMIEIGMDLGLVLGGFALGVIISYVWIKEVQKKTDAKTSKR